MRFPCIGIHQVCCMFQTISSRMHGIIKLNWNIAATQPCKTQVQVKIEQFKRLRWKFIKASGRGLVHAWLYLNYKRTVGCEAFYIQIIIIYLMTHSFNLIFHAYECLVITWFNAISSVLYMLGLDWYAWQYYWVHIW